MLVKYCPNCQGKPYTENMGMQRCPFCGSTLNIESADNYGLAGRGRLPEDTMPIKESEPEKKPTEESIWDIPSQSSFVPQKKHDDSIVVSDHPKIGTNARDSSAGQRIKGKVSQYSSSGKEDGAYRRLFIAKIIDAVVYHQRFEDVLHRFNVRVDNGKDNMGYSQYSDIPVNVHGTIASGMQITDNAEVEVEGKYRNGVLMASKVSVVNNGYRSQIKFQRSISAIVYGILAAIAAIVVIVFVANTDGNFFENLKSFLITWVVVSAVTSVLYLLLILTKIGFLIRMTSGRRMKFPIVGILLFSLIITTIFMNSFGLGTSLSGLFASLLSVILPVAIVIIVIIFLVKLIFK